MDTTMFEIPGWKIQEMNEEFSRLRRDNAVFKVALGRIKSCGSYDVRVIAKDALEKATTRPVEEEKTTETSFQELLEEG